MKLSKRTKSMILKLIVPMVVLFGTLISLDLWIIATYRDNLLVVFFAMIFLTFLVNPFVALIGKRIALKGAKEMVRNQGFGIKEKTILGVPISSLKFNIGLRLAYILAYFSVGFIYWRVEVFLGNAENSFSFVFYFTLSILITIIIVKGISYMCRFLGVLGLKISLKTHQLKLARLFIADNAPIQAYDAVEKTIYNMYLLSTVIIPLIILLSEDQSPFFLLVLALLIFNLPTMVVLFKKKKLPEEFFFELPSFFIPLQIVTALVLFMVIVSTYFIIYHLRFSIGADWLITIPFNIPRSFDLIFQHDPWSLPYGKYFEVIATTLALSIGLTWLLAVFFKKAWKELSIGLSSIFVVVMIPLILELNPWFVKWFKDHSKFLPNPVIAATIPILVGIIGQIVFNIFFPKKKLCSNPYCWYDKIDSFSIFCPRCGHVVPGKEHKIDEINYLINQRVEEFERNEAQNE